jgi:hypothetical protein
LAFGVQRDAQVVVRYGKSRFESDGLFELGDSGGVLAFGVQRAA